MASSVPERQPVNTASTAAFIRDVWRSDGHLERELRRAVLSLISIFLQVGTIIFIVNYHTTDASKLIFGKHLSLDRVTDSKSPLI